jgi:hypothetical protein
VAKVARMLDQASPAAERATRGALLLPTLGFAQFRDDF